MEGEKYEYKPGEDTGDNIKIPKTEVLRVINTAIPSGLAVICQVPWKDCYRHGTDCIGYSIEGWQREILTGRFGYFNWWIPITNCSYL